MIAAMTAILQQVQEVRPRSWVWGVLWVAQEEEVKIKEVKEGAEVKLIKRMEKAKPQTNSRKMPKISRNVARSKQTIVYNIPIVGLLILKIWEVIFIVFCLVFSVYLFPRKKMMIQKKLLGFWSELLDLATI